MTIENTHQASETRDDPYIQRRIAKKQAKAEYKARVKAAKQDYRAEKKEANQELKAARQGEGAHPANETNSTGQ
ncbi:MAG TPA: hypothetical protein VJ603_07315 [Paucimonas sp.]|nr:hypothetical protein [Paucimonas sp.]HJW55739.1 hypothetical protein [Burkholderiaceae bacterium]